MAIPPSFRPGNRTIKQYLGTIDRTLHVTVGISLIAYGIMNHRWIGTVPLLTAAFSAPPTAR